MTYGEPGVQLKHWCCCPLRWTPRTGRILRPKAGRGWWPDFDWSPACGCCWTDWSTCPKPCLSVRNSNITCQRWSQGSFRVLHFSLRLQSLLIAALSDLPVHLERSFTLLPFHAFITTAERTCCYQWPQLRAFEFRNGTRNWPLWYQAKIFFFSGRVGWNKRRIFVIIYLGQTATWFEGKGHLERDMEARRCVR